MVVQFTNWPLRGSLTDHQNSQVSPAHIGVDAPIYYRMRKSARFASRTFKGSPRFSSGRGVTSEPTISTNQESGAANI